MCEGEELDNARDIFPPILSCVLFSDPLRTLNGGEVQNVHDIRAFECQNYNTYSWLVSYNTYGEHIAIPVSFFLELRPPEKLRTEIAT